MPTPIDENTFNILDFGAADGEECSQEINAAIKAAGKSGGTVWCPSGKYLLNRSIEIPEDARVTIEGAGWGKNPDAGAGTWFIIEKDGTKFWHNTGEIYESGKPRPEIDCAIVFSGDYSEIRKIGIFQDRNPNDLAPNVAAIINSNGSGTKITDMNLYNPSIGIYHANGGGTIYSGIRGGPVHRALLVNYCMHVMTIADWDLQLVSDWRAKYPDAFQHLRSEGACIESHRNDVPTFRDIFALWYRWGILLTGDQQHNTKGLTATNIRLDEVGTGIEVLSQDSTVNLSGYFAGWKEGYAGIWIKADGVDFLASQVSIDGSAYSLIHVEGSGQLVLTNAVLKGWDSRRRGISAIETSTLVDCGNTTHFIPTPGENPPHYRTNGAYGKVIRNGKTYTSSIGDRFPDP